MNPGANVGERYVGQRQQSFYDFNEAGAQTFWDPNTQSAVAIDEGEKVKRLSLIKRDPTNVVKKTSRPP